MTVEIIAQPVPSLPHPISRFRAIWPMAALGVGLTATVAWMALLGYGLVELTETALSGAGLFPN